jgi:hypothetical protein
MRDDSKMRQSSPQPTIRPFKLPSSTRRDAFGAHDTAQGPLHGAAGEDSNPNFHASPKRKQQKMRKWPYD